MRAFCIAGCVLVLAGVVLAQEGGGMGGYDAMQLRTGFAGGSFGEGFQFEEMSGGVDITLLSDDPEKKPLPIRAQTMHFSWEGESETPSRIEMVGNVVVNHPLAQISAERADWDFGKGVLVFTGNPVMNGASMKNARASKFTLNFEEGTWAAEDLQVEEVDTQNSSGAAADPSQLRESDVSDWPGLIGTLKTQAAADAPSPGKRISALLDENLQAGLTNATTEALVGQKKVLTKQFNKVLQKPEFYDEASWAGVTLNEEAQGLLAAEKRSEAQVLRLNRLLVEAAYPKYFVKR